MSLTKEVLKAKTWAVAANWQLIAAKALIVALVIGGAYWKGRQDMETNYLEAENRRALDVVKDVQEFLPTVQKQEQRAAALHEKLNKQGKEYDEAVDKAGSKPQCNLSDDELRSIQGMAEG